MLDTLWLELTGQCNFECVHCYADSGPYKELAGTLSCEECRRIIEDAARLGCERLQFIGGEPTIVPFLGELVAYSRACGIPIVEVFTNASRLSDTLIGVFREYDASIAVSFYSDIPEAHDAVTCLKGSHASTTDGIRRLISAGVDTRVCIIETELNAGRVPETRHYVESLGVTDIWVDQMREIGRGKQFSSKTPGSDLIRIGGLQSQAVSQYANVPWNELCGHCGDRRLAVLPDGSVSPCVMSRGSRLGSIKTHSLEELMMGPELCTFRQEFRQQLSLVQGLTERSGQCSPNSPKPGVAPDPSIAPDRSPQCSPNSPTPGIAPDRSPQCSPNSPTPGIAPDRSPQCSPNSPTPGIAPDRSPQCSPNSPTPGIAPDRSPQCSPNSPTPGIAPDRSPQCSPNSPTPGIAPDPGIEPERSPQCSPNSPTPGVVPERDSTISTDGRSSKFVNTLAAVLQPGARDSFKLDVEAVADNSDIYRFPFFTADQCAQFAEITPHLNYVASHMVRGNDDGYRTSGTVFLEHLNSGIYKQFCEYAEPILQHVTRSAWDWDFDTFTDVGIIEYQKSTFYREHVDAADSYLHARRHLSFVIYLSDSFVGGETSFRRQSISVAPKAGYGIVFPAGVTHPHQAMPVSDGTKYVIVGWLTRHR